MPEATQLLAQFASSLTYSGSRHRVHHPVGQNQGHRGGGTLGRSAVDLAAAPIAHSLAASRSAKRATVLE